MAKTFVCKNCGRRKPLNLRLKGRQDYCGDPECQRARKRIWQNNKMAHDSDYRDRQIACLTRWRKQRPLDKYQRQYREEHPEYVENNRRLQKRRNEKRAKQAELAKIVKMDTLKMSSEKLDTYLMNPYKVDSVGKIVKMDALIVQLADIQTHGDLVLSLMP
jgi:ribosomal protein L37E